MIARNGNGDETVGRGGERGAHRWDVIVQHMEYHSLKVFVCVLCFVGGVVYLNPNPSTLNPKIKH